MTRDPANPETPPESPTDGPSERKERVLHTRVPAVLERELKRLAESVRMPVSNVVRAILEEAVDVADRASGRVEEQLKHATERLSAEREQIRALAKTLDPLERVVAYQSVTLAQTTACRRCGKSLTVGSAGALGLTDEPGPRIIVCTDCVPKPQDHKEKAP